jgi:hypothetical protein
VFGHVEGHPKIYSVAENRTANEKYGRHRASPNDGEMGGITAADQCAAYRLL